MRWGGLGFSLWVLACTEAPGPEPSAAPAAEARLACQEAGVPSWSEGLSLPLPAAQALDERDQACLACHQGIEQPGHELPCATCHDPQASVEASEGLSARAAVAAAPLPERRPADHPPVLANPAAPGSWQAACGGCHPEALRRLDRGLHLSLAGLINHTRYLWGAQQQVVPTQLDLVDLALQQAKTPSAVTDPALLADDLLRRSCLRCHLLSPGEEAAGLRRGAGCAACHVPYAEDGVSRSGDRALQGARERPAVHLLTRPASSAPCLACHHGDATGADFVGLFPADDHDDFRVPLADGRERAPCFGQDYHRLVPDLHQRAGLGCVDCHVQDEVMGSLRGPTPALAREAVQVRCASCHGGLVEGRDGIVPEGLRCADGGCVLQLRTPDLEVPQLRRAGQGGPPGHRSEHGDLACQACHAAWAGQSFGLHLHRSQVPTWNLWSRRALQGDPELARRVAQAMALDPSEREALAPQMSDRLTGEVSAGLWASGRTLRRWEQPALGRRADGRVSPLRPRHGYQITSVEADGLVWLNSVTPQRGDDSGQGRASEPFTPHSTMAQGALCDRCHGNPRAAGLGLAVTAESPALHAATLPDPPATPGARLLNEQERQRLLQPSAAQRQAYAEALRLLGLEVWLPER